MDHDFTNYVYVSPLDKLGLILAKKYTHNKLDKSFFDNIDMTKFVESTVGHGKEEILDKNIRSSKIIKNLNVQLKSQYEYVSKNLNPKKIKPISHSLECKFSYELNLIKYESGDHFNEFHYDTRKKNEIATVLIFSPYNKFTGGNLIFKIDDKTLTLNTSEFSNTEYTIVIFSDILHKCEPIISGVRYVFKTTILSEMPKVLSDDCKFKLSDMEKYNFNEPLYGITYKIKDELYNRMVKDIYYFYNGNKPEENQHIIILDGNPYNLEKNNLVLVSK